MVMHTLQKAITTTFCLILLSGCTKSGGGGDSDSTPDRSNSSSGGNSSATNEITTNCGTVLEGKLSNPVNFEDGIPSTIEDILGNNLLIISAVDETGVRTRLLVKLQGVGSGPANRTDAAKSLMRQLSYEETRFFPAADNCIATLENGGLGTVGQLITRSGESFGESVVKAGLADADTADVCGGEQIGTCMKALEGSEIEPMGEIDYFLWKPESDTKGPIMVMHELHCNAVAIVNGQQLEYRGSGNGRCGTYVGTRSGCAYGANIKVEILDKTTGRPYTYQGQPYVIIPNGCNRVEINPR